MTAKKRPSSRRRDAKKAKPRRATHSLALAISDPKGLIPQQQQASSWALTQEPMMNFSFIGKFKLSEKQIKALRRPVTDDEIDWKPLRKDGPPEIPYLGHNGSRDRLDAAFGLGGWGMVPTGIPKEKDDVVYVPYALVVDGVPRAYGWGEQYYDPKNRQMTYGDALEGAKSSAITRCGKELGIARELWSKKYIAGLKLRVLGPSRPSRQRDDAPPPPTVRTGQEQETISQGQYTRLRDIMRDAKRTKDEVLAYLKAFYGVARARDIKKKDYLTICKAVEGKGPLPKKEKPREADEILPPSANDINWGLK